MKEKVMWTVLLLALALAGILSRVSFSYRDAAPEAAWRPPASTTYCYSAPQPVVKKTISAPAPIARQGECPRCGSRNLTTMWINASIDCGPDFWVCRECRHNWRYDGPRHIYRKGVKSPAAGEIPVPVAKSRSCPYCGSMRLTTIKVNDSLTCGPDFWWCEKCHRKWHYDGPRHVSPAGMPLHSSIEKNAMSDGR